MPDVRVRVDGLRELRRTINRLDRGIGRDMTKALREAAAPVVREAQAHAPVLSGQYRASIKASARGHRLSVGSRLPQANVVHWGGTIQPRGVPIRFERRATIWDAAVKERGNLVGRLDEAIASVWEER